MEPPPLFDRKAPSAAEVFPVLSIAIPDGVGPTQRHQAPDETRDETAGSAAADARRRATRREIVQLRDAQRQRGSADGEDVGPARHARQARAATPPRGPRPALADPLRESLAALKTSALKKRALALGATADQLAAVTDADDRQAAAVELVLSVRGTLVQTKLSVLETRLRSLGATDEQMEELDDAEDAKAYAVELIWQLAAPAEPPSRADALPTANRAPPPLPTELAGLLPVPTWCRRLWTRPSATPSLSLTRSQAIVALARALAGTRFAVRPGKAAGGARIG